MTLVQFASLGEGRKGKAAHLRLESVMCDNSDDPDQPLQVSLNASRPLTPLSQIRDFSHK